MEANNFRFESHVAQQSRRDKLRINQQNSDVSQHYHQDYNTNIENAKYGAVSYDPSMFHASGMLNYAGGPSCDWIDNYSSNSGGVENNQNPNPVFGSSLYVKPSCYYQDVQSSLANSSNEITANLHYNPSSFYQNTLQEVVTSATIGATHGVEMASLAQPTGRGSWVIGQNDSNELLLLPNYGDQSDPVRVNGGSNWVNRPVFDNSNTQGLSLSLSSVPSTKSHENLRPDSSVFNDLQDSKAPKPGYGNRVSGSTRMEISNFTHPNTGPLGPFTGYATILKSSKYMKPTQQMLIEFCSVNGSKTISTHEMYSEMIKEVRGSGGDVNADESTGGAKGGDSGASSSTFYDSNEISGEVGGQNSSAESYRPEYQQKKAKLLYMQEEVCRRYKQYHQQMQMVVSSFESVAGLSTATPYISQALKAVSRHFRCLKNAISDQLRHIKKSLGEELASRTTGTSTSKGDTSASRLKFMDNTFQKYKPGGTSLGFFEPQQPVWRPQRGLPERAVSVLRAWLFDHFLHPYPTDTDKHMLATQTGLTRNQVSNWFINARVRVWKPMVEEIHTLETKGLAEPNPNAANAQTEPPSEGGSRPRHHDQSMNRFHISSMPNEQVGYSGIGSSTNLRDEPMELWNQEKRSRVECQMPGPPVDGSFMGFVPYQRGGFENIGGLGAVSLTLGLRQSAESSQQQLQQEHQIRQHFGGQMIHDFVG